MNQKYTKWVGIELVFLLAVHVHHQCAFILKLKHVKAILWPIRK